MVNYCTVLINSYDFLFHNVLLTLPYRMDKYCIMNSPFLMVDIF